MDRILIIEDDRGIREGLLLVLRAERMVVTHLEDFEDVPTSLASSETPDLILADWRLRKGLTGGNVAQEVEDHFDKDIPLLILTGEDNDVVNCITNQGYVVIRKPASVDELLEHIVRLIQ